jgi:hypothetical protein
MQAKKDRLRDQQQLLTSCHSQLELRNLRKLAGAAHPTCPLEVDTASALPTRQALSCILYCNLFTTIPSLPLHISQ